MVVVLLKVTHKLCHTDNYTLIQREIRLIDRPLQKEISFVDVKGMNWKCGLKQ